MAPVHVGEVGVASVRDPGRKRRWREEEEEVGGSQDGPFITIQNIIFEKDIVIG